MAGTGWASGRMLRIRVELDGSEPLIWRQVVLAWLPEGFDPASFDVLRANSRLAHRLPATR